MTTNPAEHPAERPEAARQIIDEERRAVARAQKDAEQVQRMCSATDWSLHDDQVPVAHHAAAVEEGFTTRGQWEPLCERHVRAYTADRRRPLRTAQDGAP